MNRVDIFFEPCSPAPSRGYKLWWKVQGAGGGYTNGGNFFISPATFFDDDNPEGTEYEGVLIADCGGVAGGTIPWSTTGGGESGESGSGGGGPHILSNMQATIENCFETLPIQITDIKFNGITATPVGTGSYPLNAGEVMSLLVSNYATAGTLTVFVGNNTSGGNVRITVVDSNSNTFCSSGIAQTSTSFFTFDIELGGTFPVIINIDCGECE